MKDIIYVILFLLIFIIFGILLRHNQIVLNKIQKMEKEIINNISIKTNTKGDLIFSKRLN